MSRSFRIVEKPPSVRPTSTGVHELELELYRRIFNSANDAIAIIDADGYYLQQNPAHERLLGYTDREVNGQTPAIHMGDEGFARVAAELARTGHFEGELNSRTKAGEAIVIELSAFTMLDASGRVLCHVGVKRDVTQRRRADDELQSRARQQAAVAELGQQALAGMELDALLQQAAKSVSEMLRTDFCKILELLPDEKQMFLRAGSGWRDGLVGHTTLGTEDGSQGEYTLRSSAPVIVEDLAQETRFRSATLLRQHNVVSGISVIIAGRERPWGVIGAHTRSRRKFNRDDINFLTAVANVLATAIERKQAEEALRETEKRLALAQRASNTAIWDWDMLTGRLHWTSSGNELNRIHTRSMDSIAQWIETLHPEDRDWVFQRIERAIAERCDFDAEFRTLSSDGSIRWLASRGQVLYGDRGTPTRMIGFTMDVTARKQAEELMQRSEKLAMIGRLAASIAHEINNPLESVTNLLYLIEHHAGTPADVRSYAQVAQRELGRVAHISRQTLGFYRDSTAAVPVDMAELLDDLIRLYARKFDRKHVHVERRYRVRRDVQVFPAEIRQVVSNLLLNALEASAEDGTLHVRVSEATHPRQPEVHGVRITIADQGCGIPAALQHKIFDAFFTTKGEKGTGLGLWVSNGIVQKHGGNIRLRSSTDPSRHGTVFTVFLPAAERAASEPQVSVEAAS